MAASADLPLPVMIISLIKIISALPMASPPPEFDNMGAVTLLGSPTEGFVFVSEDYDVLDYSVTTSVPFITTNGRNFKKCDYKPCLANQPACSEMAASTRCLCPGFTLHNVPPEAPDLRSVSLNGSEVIVQWCAPLSFITEYIVTVGGKEKYTFKKEQRSGSIGKVDNVVQVCVSAVNDAGESDGSCVMYQPKDSSLPLKAGLIGGALGFLLLLLLVVLLCRRRRQRKQEANISLGNEASAQ